jgi:hypothetical protein
MIEALSLVDAALAVGEPWAVTVLAVDYPSTPSGTAPTLTVTNPAGVITTPVMDAVAGVSGVYRAFVATPAPGRYVARVSHDSYVHDFAAYATPVATAAGMPDLDDLLGPGGDGTGYLGVTSLPEEQVQDALDAEAANQRRVCRIPAAYGADLRQALLRRVARNLAMQGLPLAVLRGDGEGGDATLLPGNDPEVKRFERPYRKVPIG